MRIFRAAARNSSAAVRSPAPRASSARPPPCASSKAFSARSRMSSADFLGSRQRLCHFLSALVAPLCSLRGDTMVFLRLPALSALKGNGP